MYQIPLDRKKIVARLSMVAGFLIVMHGLLMTYHYLIEETPWYLMQLFDMNEEHNLPTWFSGFILLIATAFLGIVTRDKRSSGDQMKGRWTILFLGFCFLSIDEIAGLHESLNSVIDPSWAWGGLIISVLLGVYFIPFLRTLPRTSIRDFVVSGVVYVGGAVGMELVGQPLDGDALPYNMSTMVEEGMEIFGIILFIRALLSYMSNDKTEIEVEFTV